MTLCSSSWIWALEILLQRAARYCVWRVMARASGCGEVPKHTLMPSGGLKVFTKFDYVQLKYRRSLRHDWDVHTTNIFKLEVGLACRQPQTFTKGSFNHATEDMGVMRPWRWIVDRARSFGADVGVACRQQKVSEQLNEDTET
ncbi:hypothetical protein K439DRAFT_1664270 [Ramaria rubella]|nr:hypothetical protein K439DRAFT_1664270 [Ramaria rubella]